MGRCTGAASGGTSGKGGLAVGGEAAVHAGAGGQWLLDPSNVTLVGSGGGTTAPLPDPLPSAPHQVRASTPTNALNAGTDVAVATTSPVAQAGDITLATAPGASLAGWPPFAQLQAARPSVTPSFSAPMPFAARRAA